MLRMSDLIALLSKKMTKEMPTPSPRNKNYKRRSVRISKMIPNHQKMDKLEEYEMEKSRPVVKIS